MISGLGGALMELREAHRHKGDQAVGDVVTVFDDKLPRGLWKLGKIEELIPGADNQVRGAKVRVHVDSGKTNVIQRSVLKLYPLEVKAETCDQSTKKSNVVIEPKRNPKQHPRRQAVVRAKEKIRKWVTEITEPDEYG